MTGFSALGIKVGLGVSTWTGLGVLVAGEDVLVFPSATNTKLSLLISSFICLEGKLFVEVVEQLSSSICSSRVRGITDGEVRAEGVGGSMGGEVRGFTGEGAGTQTGSASSWFTELCEPD